MTKVTFRKVYDGEIIAVFDLPWGYFDGNLLGYAHIGQHTPISYDFYRNCTSPATPTEYADLLAELKAVGYDDLKVCKRLDIAKIFRYWN